MSPEDTSWRDLISAVGTARSQDAQEIMGTDKTWNCRIKLSSVLFLSGYQWEELKKGNSPNHSLQLWNPRITNPGHKYSQVSSAVLSFPTKHFPQQTNTWNLPLPSQVVEIFFPKAWQNLVLNAPRNVPFQREYFVELPLEAVQLPWNGSNTGRSKWTCRPQESPGVPRVVWVGMLPFPEEIWFPTCPGNGGRSSWCLSR